MEATARGRLVSKIMYEYLDGFYDRAYFAHLLSVTGLASYGLLEISCYLNEILTYADEIMLLYIYIEASSKKYSTIASIAIYSPYTFVNRSHHPSLLPL